MKEKNEVEVEEKGQLRTISAFNGGRMVYCVVNKTKEEVKVLVLEARESGWTTDIVKQTQKVVDPPIRLASDIVSSLDLVRGEAYYQGKGYLHNACKGEKEQNPLIVVETIIRKKGEETVSKIRGECPRCKKAGRFVVIEHPDKWESVKPRRKVEKTKQKADKRVAMELKESTKSRNFRAITVDTSKMKVDKKKRCVDGLGYKDLVKKIGIKTAQAIWRSVGFSK